MNIDVRLKNEHEIKTMICRELVAEGWPQKYIMEALKVIGVVPYNGTQSDSWKGLSHAATMAREETEKAILCRYANLVYEIKWREEEKKSIEKSLDILEDKYSGYVYDKMFKIEEGKKY